MARIGVLIIRIRVLIMLGLTTLTGQAHAFPFVRISRPARLLRHCRVCPCTDHASEVLMSTDNENTCTD